MQYADDIYKSALRMHRMNAYLKFRYGNFLAYYRKNYLYAMRIFNLTVNSLPSTPLQFVIYSLLKQSGEA
jgi:Tfp pilus assembly protein PilF